MDAGTGDTAVAGGSDPLTQLRDHNREVMRIFHSYIERIDQEPEVNLGALGAFLREELLPHMHAEELHLCPVLDPILREHGRPTAAMGVEHEFISRAIHVIEDRILSYEMEHSGAQRLGIRREISYLLVALDALIRVQLEKENRIYAPLLSEHLDPSELRRVFDDIRRRELTEALAG